MPKIKEVTPGLARELHRQDRARAKKNAGMTALQRAQAGDGMFYEYAEVQERAAKRIDALKDPRRTRVAKTIGMVASASFLALQKKVSARHIRSTRARSERHDLKSKYLDTSLAPRLKDKSEARNNAAEQTRRKQLGTAVLRNTAKVAKDVARRSGAKASMLQARAQRQEANQGKGPVTQKAERYLDRLYEDEIRKNKERSRIYGEETTKFMDENPEVAAALHDHNSKKERREWERILRNKRVRTIQGLRHENPDRVVSNVRTKEYFEGDSSYDGNLPQLAKHAFEVAVTHRQPDGTVPLYSEGMFDQYEQKAAAKGTPLSEVTALEDLYQEGLATAVVGMGFMQPAGDKSFDEYEGGRLARNQQAELSQTENQTLMRIPFDASNEFHAMLLPEGSSGEGLALQLAMPKDSYTAKPQPEYLNLSVVDLAIEAQQTAA